MSSKRQEPKYKINRRLQVNLWGRPKSPLNHREYGPGQHGQRRKKPSDFGTQLAAKQMIAQGDGGLIINLSSVHEDWPMPGNTVYYLTKGGMRMLTRTAGVELAKHNILVVGVGPGAVATPINLQTMTQWNQQLRARQRELQQQKQQEEAQRRAERDARVEQRELVDGTTLNNLLM